MEYAQLKNLEKRIQTHAPWLILQEKPKDTTKQVSWFFTAAEDIFGVHVNSQVGLFCHHLEAVLVSRHSVFQSLVLNSAIQKKVAENIFGELRTHYKNSILPMILQCGISFEQYASIRKQLDFKVSQTGERLPFHINTQRVKLFPGHRTMSEKYKMLIDRHLHLSRIETPLFIVWERPLVEILKFQFKHMKQFMKFKIKDKIHVTVRMDAFPIGGGHALCFLYSLTEFGKLSKLPLFQRIGNIAYTNDKNYEHVLQAWGTNLKYLQHLQKDKKVLIDHKTYTVEIIFCADTAGQRMELGLNSASSVHSCFQCLWNRNYGHEQKFFRRNLQYVQDFISRDLFGQKHPPMLTGLPYSSHKLCLLHMEMAFGKMLAKFIFSRMSNLQNQEYAKNIVEEWQNKNKLRFSITEPNERKTWYVSGRDARKMMEPNSWNSLCTHLAIPEQSKMAVTNLSTMFQHLRESTDNGNSWLTENCQKVVETFQTHIAPLSKSFYLHYALHHLVHHIEENGNDFWLFCQDVQETLQCQLKRTFLTATSRHDFLREAVERLEAKLLSVIETPGLLIR